MKLCNGKSETILDILLTFYNCSNYLLHSYLVVIFVEKGQYGTYNWCVSVLQKIVHAHQFETFPSEYPEVSRLFCVCFACIADCIMPYRPAAAAHIYNSSSNPKWYIVTNYQMIAAMD